MYRMAWTDERMDDFAKSTDRRFESLERRMDSGFSKIDAETRALREEIRAGFAKIDDSFGRIDDRFERVDERFEAMQRLLFQSSVLVIVALIGLIATQLKPWRLYAVAARPTGAR